MNNINGTEKIKKPYKKPKVEAVKLMAEEAILAGCKTPTSSIGPHKNHICRPQGRCMAYGS